MFSNLAYLLTSKSITLYILYTLHVMLGTSLVFTALYTYGLHSSKAMARAAALEASMQAGVNGIPTMGNGSAVEFEDDMDIEVDGMDIAIGGLDGTRKVKSMIGLSSRRAGWENVSGSLGYEGGNLGMKEREMKFREICYSSGGKEGVEVDVSMPVVSGKGISVEIS
ncbi:hypothetical protein OCU04_011795 [Sclerotinia nivalis]|uniref:Uncharacterized protein n=1 Tax=Sclerotinia nivalis TaxID=352851 RepID=A0A9X0A9T0_9HELO|nr:hypothetical protein OCU04_011795 [Sclerotinia nivalis]